MTHAKVKEHDKGTRWDDTCKGEEQDWDDAVQK